MTRLQTPETPHRNKSKTSSRPNPRSPAKDRARTAIIDALMEIGTTKSWATIIGPYGPYRFHGNAWQCPACLLVMLTPTTYGLGFAMLCPRHQKHQRLQAETPETDPQKIRAALYRALLLLDGAGDLFITRQAGHGCLYYGER